MHYNKCSNFLSELRGKLNADLWHQRNNLEQVFCWNINNMARKKKKKKSGKTLETLVSYNSGCLPGAAQAVHSSHAGSRKAREMLGLGTQALKPWGLKHQATDNDVLYQSFSSKPITKVGSQENGYIIPVCLDAAPFLSAKTPEHKQAMLRGLQLTPSTKATQFKKLCIFVEELFSKRRVLIASINQSIYWHVKPTLTICWELQSCIKYIRKLVICHLSSVKTDDKWAQSLRLAVVVIGNFCKI